MALRRVLCFCGAVLALRGDGLSTRVSRRPPTNDVSRREVLKFSSLVAPLVFVTGSCVVPENGGPSFLGGLAASAADNTEDASLLLEEASTKRALLGAIPATPSGAPATNATVSPATVTLIESLASRLETTSRTTRAATSPLLDGSWRLIYSNADEIVTLAKLPLGFQLETVLQPFDLEASAFENQARVGHKYLRNFATGSTRVVGDFALDQSDPTLNRVDVDFRRVVFTLDRPVTFKKVVKPRRDPSASVRPAVTVTYLDPDLRLTRGANGALFVLVRDPHTDNTPPSDASRVVVFPMLSPDERRALYADALQADDVVSGAGLANWTKATTAPRFGG